MRLIDADALIKRCMNGIDNEFIAIVNEQPTVCDIEQIRAEIRQITDEETEHDEKWAIGLRYAVKIIDKYKGDKE